MSTAGWIEAERSPHAGVEWHLGLQVLRCLLWLRVVGSVGVERIHAWVCATARSVVLQRPLPFWRRSLNSGCELHVVECGFACEGWITVFAALLLASIDLPQQVGNQSAAIVVIQL